MTSKKSGRRRATAGDQGGDQQGPPTRIIPALSGWRKVSRSLMDWMLQCRSATEIRIVLYALRHTTDDAAATFIGARHIAAIVGCSRPWAQECLERLNAQGILVRVYRTKGRAYAYRIRGGEVEPSPTPDEAHIAAPDVSTVVDTSGGSTALDLSTAVDRSGGAPGSDLSTPVDLGCQLELTQYKTGDITPPPLPGDATVETAPPPPAAVAASGAAADAAALPLPATATPPTAKTALAKELCGLSGGLPMPEGPLGATLIRQARLRRAWPHWLRLWGVPLASARLSSYDAVLLAARRLGVEPEAVVAAAADAAGRERSGDVTRMSFPGRVEALAKHGPSAKLLSEVTEFSTPRWYHYGCTTCSKEILYDDIEPLPRVCPHCRSDIVKQLQRRDEAIAKQKAAELARAARIRNAHPTLFEA